MKKSHLILLITGLVLIAGFIWLLNGTNVKNLQRQETTIKIQDTFEK
ncbi:MAG: hypothetical protein V3U57_02250 [Robiginitomaculum sp.]